MNSLENASNSTNSPDKNDQPKPCDETADSLKGIAYESFSNNSEVASRGKDLTKLSYSEMNLLSSDFSLKSEEIPYLMAEPPVSDSEDDDSFPSTYKPSLMNTPLSSDKLEYYAQAKTLNEEIMASWMESDSSDDEQRPGDEAPNNFEEESDMEEFENDMKGTQILYKRLNLSNKAHDHEMERHISNSEDVKNGEQLELPNDAENAFSETNYLDLKDIVNNIYDDKSNSEFSDIRLKERRNKYYLELNEELNIPKDEWSDDEEHNRAEAKYLKSEYIMHQSNNPEFLYVKRSGCCANANYTEVNENVNLMEFSNAEENYKAGENYSCSKELVSIISDLKGAKARKNYHTEENDLDSEELNFIRESGYKGKMDCFEENDLDVKEKVNTNASVNPECSIQDDMSFYKHGEHENSSDNLNSKYCLNSSEYSTFEASDRNIDTDIYNDTSGVDRKCLLKTGRFEINENIRNEHDIKSSRVDADLAKGKDGDLLEACDDVELENVEDCARNSQLIESKKYVFKYQQQEFGNSDSETQYACLLEDGDSEIQQIISKGSASTDDSKSGSELESEDNKLKANVKTEIKDEVLKKTDELYINRNSDRTLSLEICLSKLKEAENVSDRGENPNSTSSDQMKEKCSRKSLECEKTDELVYTVTCEEKDENNARRKSDETAFNSAARRSQKKSHGNEKEIDLSTALRFMTEVYHSKDEFSSDSSSEDIPIDYSARNKTDSASVIPNVQPLSAINDAIKSSLESSKSGMFVPTPEKENGTKPRSKFSKFIKSFKSKLIKKP